MLLDEKEADAEAHEGEKEALWRRIQVKSEASPVTGGAPCLLSSAASGLRGVIFAFWAVQFFWWILYCISTLLEGGAGGRLSLYIYVRDVAWWNEGYSSTQLTGRGLNRPGRLPCMCFGAPSATILLYVRRCPCVYFAQTEAYERRQHHVLLRSKPPRLHQHVLRCAPALLLNTQFDRDSPAPAKTFSQFHKPLTTQDMARRVMELEQEAAESREEFSRHQDQIQRQALAAAGGGSGVGVGVVGGGVNRRVSVGGDRSEERALRAKNEMLERQLAHMREVAEEAQLELAAVKKVHFFLFFLLPPAFRLVVAPGADAGEASLVWGLSACYVAAERINSSAATTPSIRKPPTCWSQRIHTPPVSQALAHAYGAAMISTLSDHRSRPPLHLSLALCCLRKQT